MYCSFENWQDDGVLKEQLRSYVGQMLKRSEILNFVERDFPQYPWSLRSLDRRLRHFNIYYSDTTVSVDEVKDVVSKELDGPGQLLGYRAMQRKVRQEHGLFVPRALVYSAMADLDPDGLQERSVGQKKKREKGHFTSKGPDFVHSVDGHDKLMGYQNSTFPLAVYGCIDTASRKLMWLRVWVTNSEPLIVGRWYLDYLYENLQMPACIRMDRGTETGIMSTMHAFLRSQHNDVEEGDASDTVIYGPSTSNQIERWWKELHERLEKYFKVGLSELKEHGDYDPKNEQHRMLLAYIMIPLLQRELDVFKDTVWNSHRIRAQKGTTLPSGVPNHIHAFPEEYNLEHCGFPVTPEELQEVARISGVLDAPEDFLEPDFRASCETIIPSTDEIDPKDFKNAYLYLKDNFTD